MFLQVRTLYFITSSFSFHKVEIKHSLQEIWARSGNTKNESWQLNCIAALMKRAHSVRSLGSYNARYYMIRALKLRQGKILMLISLIGSAAINLAFVAAGQADAYSQSLISCWDFAAGALIVKEAGGVVLDPHGGRDFDLMSRRILVTSSQKLAEEILAIEDLKPPTEVVLKRDHPDMVHPF